MLENKLICSSTLDFSIIFEGENSQLFPINESLQPKLDCKPISLGFGFIKVNYFSKKNADV